MPGEVPQLPDGSHILRPVQFWISNFSLSYPSFWMGLTKLRVNPAIKLVRIWNLNVGIRLAYPLLRSSFQIQARIILIGFT
jgi:hypothetical protein